MVNPVGRGSHPAPPLPVGRGSHPAPSVSHPAPSVSHPARPARAIIYIRVTADMRRRPGGMAGQAAGCVAFAESRGMEILHITSDPGDSVEVLLKRPNLPEALRRIREGEADVLVTLTPSPDPADVKAIAKMSEHVAAAGGKLLCSDSADAVGEGPLSSSVYTLFRAVAELVKNLELEEKRRCRKKAAASGCQPNGVAPYGYISPTHADVLIGRHATQDMNRLLVEPQAAAVVRLIFNEYLATGCLPRVSEALYAAGIRAPKGGDRWSDQVIRRILTNSSYRGEAQYYRTRTVQREDASSEGASASTRILTPSEAITIPCPPIISPDLFDAVQTRLAFARKQGPKAEKTQPYALLTRLLTCAACGSRLSSGYYRESKTHGDGFYYACRKCKPTWNAASPRPRWSTYPATAIEAILHTRLVECFSSPRHEAIKIADLLLTSTWHIPKFRRHNLLLESGLTGLVSPDPLDVKITFCNRPPEEQPLIVEAFRNRCKRVLTESLRAGLPKTPDS